MYFKSRFARNPHMAIFRWENGPNGLFFRNLHEKLGKKIYGNFFWLYWGLNRFKSEHQPFH